MTYNMTAVENANNIAELFLGVNSATQDSYVSLAGLLTIAIFIILLIIQLRTQPAAESILSSSVVCMLASLMMLVMGALGAPWVVAYGILAGVSAVGVYLKR